MNIDIRLAQPDDLHAILDISNYYAATAAANFAVEPESLDDWQRSFNDTHTTHPWLIASDDENTVLGFAKATPWKGRCAYHHAAEISVYVHPDHHRQGLGRRLYQRLFEVLEAQGYRTLIAGITLPNDASVQLHESMGMKHAATFRDIGWKFDQWHTVGYWQCHFGAGPPAPIRPVRDVC